ncbi:hypothetical protein P152DRAFT_435035 [Eremomyces bilateralis CBS 781.70]|uniref:DUF6594 domain-containing protein n=1 Tax=Eremomyces bilateralis CBS 781.70 TaxID=1392243 RepID=A0A6G1G4J3_9PEZI|nr:uncharacterized protein P152DRAFT_435035 [Eremomyces bilateralis CBS 781.70]KAF1812830.1 hypothetical protein P152DRAFT_435035 [Eremomyces bilateralis CBS 781.70]
MAAASSPQHQRPRGYHLLSRLMGRSEELAVFRKFNDLNAISLLSLQAELVLLRDEYHNICESDEKDGRPYSRNFEKLFQSKDDVTNDQYLQLLKIREKMKEYNAFLLQVASIRNIHKPRASDLEKLQEWLRDPKGGNRFLAENEAFTWSNEYKTDFATLATSTPDDDIFTNWLVSSLVKLYHRVWGHRHPLHSSKFIDEESGLIMYHDGKVARVSKIISTTLASIFPVIAVLGLYFEKDLLKRIYIMIGITGAFSLVLSIFSQARRVEIFAVTTALAAVEVVFIGSTTSPGV